MKFKERFGKSKFPNYSIHYNIARDGTGRYIVRLPRREVQGRLRESYEQERQRFNQLDRHFREHPDLHQAYYKFT